jgi:antibiotic biosynthesis monooxygenase (ABM) superfamily enzyme
MPFGLDLKSIIAGILIAWFLIPWVQGMIAKGRATAT